MEEKIKKTKKVNEMDSENNVDFIETETNFEIDHDELVSEPIKMEMPKNASINIPRRKESFDNSKVVPSCLRDEKVIVRFIPKASSLITNPKHVLYGGLAENAFREYTVPKLASSGAFKNVLTNDEKTYLEQIMGLEENALSIYKKVDNFWENYTVRLNKSDSILDLSIPSDYIKYKVILANDEHVAKSVSELEERPRPTYQFVIIKESEVDNSGVKKLNNNMKAYMLLGKYQENADVLKMIIELIEGRPLSNKIKIEALLAKANDLILSNSKLFIAVAEDKLLETKVIIKKAVEKGVVSKRGTFYYLKDENAPMCEDGQEPTLNNASMFLNIPKNQELFLSIERKIKL